jgi:hypothetical protein
VAGAAAAFASGATRGLAYGALTASSFGLSNRPACDGLRGVLTTTPSPSQQRRVLLVQDAGHGRSRRRGRRLLNGTVVREHVFAALLGCFQPAVAEALATSAPAGTARHG